MSEETYPMNTTRKHAPYALLALVVAGLTLAFSPASRAADQNDTAAAIKAKLHNQQFKNVQVSVDQNGVATLAGSVDLFEYKADADRLTHKVKGVNAVRD